MGCDIHIVIERPNDDGTWQLVGEPYRHPDDPDYIVMPEPEVLGWRNYDRFAVFANVRNGRGVAGCDTGDGFRPIAQPRGLPHDVSPEVRAWSDERGPDGHSHSWLTVREVLDYDWSQTTTHRGWVDAEAFKAWHAAGAKDRPSSYCGGVSGNRVEHVSNQEMLRRLADGTATHHHYTLISWTSTYAESCDFDNFAPLLRDLPDGCRLVFFFDS